VLTLSLDPGLKTTGWSVLEGPELVDFGILRPNDPKAGVPERIDSLCLGLEALLDAFRPQMILVEWNSSHVNVNRHKGGGAGLASHGAVCCGLWRDAVYWARRHGAKVVPVNESTWTRGVPKKQRALVVAQEYPDYQIERDPGGDIADSIALAAWWAKEEQVKQLAETR
jgi:Holliday junction resolvasome RuvABC endonuclease subunit